MEKFQYRSSIVLLLLIFFSSCTDFDKPEYPKPLEEAINYFYSENENQKVLESLKHLSVSDLKNANVFFMQKIFTAAALCELNYIDSAVNEIKNIKPQELDNQTRFWYHSIHGLILFRLKNYSQALKELSGTIESDFNDIRAIALNERILARISYTLNDQQKGAEWLLKSNKHFEQAGLMKNLGVNYKILGRNYINNHINSAGLNYFKLAEKTFLKYNDKAELFYVYINFIDYYLNTNKLDSASFYANKCITECKDVIDNSMKTILYNNLGELEIKKENYQSAIEWFDKTLAIPENYPTWQERKTTANINLSKIYRTLDNYNEAFLNAENAKRRILNTNSNLLKHNVYSELAEVHSKLNKNNTAFLFLDSADMFLDSAYSVLSKTTKTFYDTKSELVNASFSLERLEARERLQKNIYRSILIVLTLVLFFVIFIYIQQQSKNEILKELVKKNLKIIEEERKLHQALKQENELKKTVRKINGNEKSVLLYNQLIIWLQNNRQFTRKDLTIEIVAKELNTNRGYLSQAINEQNVRFNELINKYRIQEAIQIISDPTHKCNKYSLSSIANEVGFASNSVFIEAFRKQTGMNPALFRQNLANSHEP